MAAPVFIGAGSGVISVDTPVTVSKTGCTAGNLILGHIVIRGTTADWSFTNFVNCVRISGVTNGLAGLITGVNVTSLSCGIYIGRVTANGTVSGDIDAGASSEDVFCRLYEFSGASTALTNALVVENSAATFNSTGGVAGTVISDVVTVTNSAKRLALQFVALSTAQTIGDFTGETGGNWTEAVSEYSEATGQTATLQLQSATMEAPGTIDGGTVTVGSSTNWVTIGLAIIPWQPSVAWLRA